MDIDTTKSTCRAMLEGYLSNPTDEAWEQLKWAMYREAQAHGAYGAFPITSVTRDDLESHIRRYLRNSETPSIVEGVEILEILGRIHPNHTPL